jgi:hypothetical protein
MGDAEIKDQAPAPGLISQVVPNLYIAAPLAGTREEPGTLTQGAPVFPGSSRLGSEPKTPGWLVQDPTTRPIGDLIPTIGGSLSRKHKFFTL